MFSGLLERDQALPGGSEISDTAPLLSGGTDSGGTVSRRRSQEGLKGSLCFDTSCSVNHWAMVSLWEWKGCTVAATSAYRACLPQPPMEGLVEAPEGSPAL